VFFKQVLIIVYVTQVLRNAYAERYTAISGKYGEGIAKIQVAGEYPLQAGTYAGALDSWVINSTAITLGRKQLGIESRTLKLNFPTIPPVWRRMQNLQAHREAPPCGPPPFVLLRFLRAPCSPNRRNDLPQILDAVAPMVPCDLPDVFDSLWNLREALGTADR